MDRSPIALALIPIEKGAGDLHGWKEGFAGKRLHEVLGLTTSTYNGHDLQRAYSVYFHTSVRELGGKGE